MRRNWEVIGMSTVVDNTARWDLSMGGQGGTTPLLDQPGGGGISIAGKSSSANDAAAGTGGRTVRLTCIDVNDALIQQNITMNGTTVTSAAAAPVKAVLMAEVLTFGSGLKSAGVITIRKSDDTLSLLQIPLGWNRSASGRFFVPAGHKALVNRIQFDTSAQAVNRVYLMANCLPSTMIVTPATERYEFFTSVTRSNIDVYAPTRQAFPAGTILQLAAETDNGSAVRVSGVMSIDLVPDVAYAE